MRDKELRFGCAEEKSLTSLPSTLLRLGYVKLGSLQRMGLAYKHLFSQRLAPSALSKFLPKAYCRREVMNLVTNVSAAAGNANANPQQTQGERCLLHRVGTMVTLATTVTSLLLLSACRVDEPPTLNDAAAAAPAPLISEFRPPATTAAPTEILPQATLPVPIASQRHTFTKTDGPAKNPMKGWSTGTWGNNPDSTVAFTYIDWKTFEPNDQDFTSARIENQPAMDWWLNRPGTNNRHVILRVICQWDGSETKVEQLSCPAWLMQNVGLLTGQNALGQWGGTSVDFNDPDFIAQAEEMIAALGAKYNDDPKIYAIQLGLLGYWGEWHAYQFKTSSGDQGYPIATETKSRILAAYKKAFPNKLLMGRYLNDPVLAQDTRMGYHNDYFWPGHWHNNDFEFSVGEKWKQGPIGGETPPDPWWREFYNDGIGLQSIKNAHYSTMQPGGFYRAPFDPTKHDAQYRLEREEYVKAHKLMGYNFQIEQALFPASVLKGARAVPIEIDINNIGVAPFYYDWDIELALLDPSTNAALQSVKSTQKLSSLMPNQKNTISVNVPISSTLNGTYRVAIRIAQPGASTAKVAAWRLDARNTYIQFANQMTVIDARWNSNNALEGGWSVLGNVAIP